MNDNFLKCTFHKRPQSFVVQHWLKYAKPINIQLICEPIAPFYFQRTGIFSQIHEPYLVKNVKECKGSCTCSIIKQNY